jgi:hypothetical protein
MAGAALASLPARAATVNTGAGSMPGDRHSGKALAA